MMVPLRTIMEFLDTADVLVEKLELISDLAPYINEAPSETKTRLGIRLLRLIGEYTNELASLSQAFVASLPSRPIGEDPQ
jgi:hypothetical protein